MVEWAVDEKSFLFIANCSLFCIFALTLLNLKKKTLTYISS